MSLIFLIGMPGCGKSSMARLWGKSYNWTPIDMDRKLTRQHGDIAMMFATHGEGYFREKEHELLKSLIAAGSKKTIIATGGGTPCFFDNLELMKTAGCVVYIRASVEELSRRLKGPATGRPLLAGNKEERLRRLLSERDAIYSQAHFTYQTESLTEATFAEIIDTCTNRR